MKSKTHVKPLLVTNNCFKANKTRGVIQIQKKILYMLRFFSLIMAIFYSSVLLAKSKDYQVDLIIFANAQLPSKSMAPPAKIPFITDSKTVSLNESDSESSHSFRLLKPSYSSLSNEFYRLNHHPSYKILAHYSWKQPSSNQKTVLLPPIHHKGWEIQGTVHVQQSHYYFFDTKLHYSPPDQPESTFFLTQKQRVKEGMVYYFDHPQLGMILKIHH